MKELIAKKLSKGKSGKNIASEPFEIVLPRVGKDSLFKNKKYGLFLIESATELHNYQELWLPRNDQLLIKRIQARQIEESKADYELTRMYRNIAWQVDHYFRLYKIRKFAEKLQASVEDFAGLPVYKNETSDGKAEVLASVLKRLNGAADKGRTNPTTVKLQSDFGRTLLTNGIVLEDDSSIVYQSPTGLFKRSVKLVDL